MSLRKQSVSFLCFSMLIAASAASACSDVISSGFFLWGKSTRWTISGRNLDCDVTLYPELVSYPSKTEWTTTDSEGKEIKLGKTKYAFVGVKVLGKDRKLVDGMNSEGLSAALLWMEDAKFPASAIGNKAIAMSDLVGWILGNFSNVADARKSLAKELAWLDNALPYPAHLVLHDSGSSTSLVVEWTDGTATPKYIDDKNGYAKILSDAPDYKKQLDNLRNFATLSNDVYTNMFGFAGDQTSMSRFSRLSVLTKFAKMYVLWPDTYRSYEQPPWDIKPIYGSGFVLQQILMLLGRVNIVHGEAVHDSGGTSSYMHTQMTIVRDHINRKIYYRFNTELALKMVLTNGTSSATESPAVLDSQAAPRHVPLIAAPKTNAFAIPSADAESESFAIVITFPLSAMKDSGKPFIFAQTCDGKILQWTSSGKWTKAEDGALSPSKDNVPDSIRIVLSDDFMVKNPGTRIFAGHGSSDVEMLAAGAFSEVARTPDKTTLENLPRIKNLLKGIGRRD